MDEQTDNTISRVACATEKSQCDFMMLYDALGVDNKKCIVYNPLQWNDSFIQMTQQLYIRGPQESWFIF